MILQQPECSYLLCTMPRSGSTLLCDLLTQTGVAGAPNSFFRAQSMAEFSADWGLSMQTLDGFDRAYVAAAITHGSAGTGCFGLRANWHNMPGLMARLGHLFPGAKTDIARLRAAFGPVKFVHLERKDKVAEAVSLVVAEQSGLWHRNADGSELERTTPPSQPVYDAQAMQAAYDEVTNGQREWSLWFDAQGVTPLHLTYEALAAASNVEVARILEFLDLDPAKAYNLSPGTARLATARNAEWAARFRAETGLAPRAGSE